jgi:hypothetical protein
MTLTNAEGHIIVPPSYESWISQKARALATDSAGQSGSNQSKTIFWSFGDDGGGES